MGTVAIIAFVHSARRRIESVGHAAADTLVRDLDVAAAAVPPARTAVLPTEVPDSSINANSASGKNQATSRGMDEGFRIECSNLLEGSLGVPARFGISVPPNTSLDRHFRAGHKH